MVLSLSPPIWGVHSAFVTPFSPAVGLLSTVLSANTQREPGVLQLYSEYPQRQAWTREQEFHGGRVLDRGVEILRASPRLPAPGRVSLALMIVFKEPYEFLRIKNFCEGLPGKGAHYFIKLVSTASHGSC